MKRRISDGEQFTKKPIEVIGVNDHLPTPIFPLFLGQTGVVLRKKSIRI
jgi:hypothetical protein